MVLRARLIRKNPEQCPELLSQIKSTPTQDGVREYSIPVAHNSGTPVQKNARQKN